MMHVLHKFTPNIGSQMQSILDQVNTNNLSGYIPSASSIYSSVPYTQDNSILIVGDKF